MSDARRSSEAGQVIQAGQAAVDALTECSTDAVERVDAYVQAFDSWAQSTNLESSDKELGIRIADQHATIMMLMEALKGEAALALKDLREKGKGLRAYTDVFPKRISTMKPKKG
jgi:hypothetical protein